MDSAHSRGSGWPQKALLVSVGSGELGVGLVFRLRC